MSPIRAAAAALVLLTLACGGPTATHEASIETDEGAVVAAEGVAKPMSGQLVAGGARVHGPVAFVDGRTTRVTLESDGPARLYVDVDAVPSTRDYRSGAKVGVALAVEATGSELWFLVVADADVTYRIVTTTEAPVQVQPHRAPSESFAGTLDAGRAAEHGPIAVTPGATIVLTLDGTGDADLTARFDAAPTADDYDCLGISEGADSCTMVVPEGAHTLYARVVAIQASEYLLEVTTP